jgi:hypothetical protein
MAPTQEHPMYKLHEIQEVYSEQDNFDDYEELIGDFEETEMEREYFVHPSNDWYKPY